MRTLALPSAGAFNDIQIERRGRASTAVDGAHRLVGRVVEETEAVAADAGGGGLGDGEGRGCRDGGVGGVAAPWRRMVRPANEASG